MRSKYLTGVIGPSQQAKSDPGPSPMQSCTLTTSRFSFKNKDRAHLVLKSTVFHPTRPIGAKYQLMPNRWIYLVQMGLNRLRLVIK